MVEDCLGFYIVKIIRWRCIFGLDGSPKWIAHKFYFQGGSPKSSVSSTGYRSHSNFPIFFSPIFSWEEFAIFAICCVSPLETRFVLMTWTGSLSILGSNFCRFSFVKRVWQYRSVGYLELWLVSVRGECFQLLYIAGRLAVYWADSSNSKQFFIWKSCGAMLIFTENKVSKQFAVSLYETIFLYFFSSDFYKLSSTHFSKRSSSARYFFDIKISWINADLVE